VTGWGDWRGVGFVRGPPFPVRFGWLACAAAVFQYHVRAHTHLLVTRSNFHYDIHVTFEGLPNDPEVVACMASLKEVCVNIKSAAPILGTTLLVTGFSCVGPIHYVSF
jgi:hypothetical protein